MATETQDYAEPTPVLAPPHDQHGFGADYQQKLRLRIICERLAEVLGPIPQGGGVLVARRPVSPPPINQAAQTAPTPHTSDKPHAEK